MNARAEPLRKGELGVLVLCGVFVLLTLGAVGESGRERAKRAVCLANLRQLTSAWALYADQNDGRIVNGEAGMSRLQSSTKPDGSKVTLTETPWVGACWLNPYNSPYSPSKDLPEREKKRRIEEGALWPFVGDTRLYKCPVGRSYEWVNYSIVDAMNGMSRSGTTTGSYPDIVGARVGRTTLWIKRLSDVDLPAAAERMVFIDQGARTPSSYAVHYTKASWWDDPSARHNDGTTVSWADGHTSYLQWKGEETIAYARKYQDYLGSGLTPQTPEGLEDLQSIQRTVWGRLGY